MTVRDSPSLDTMYALSPAIPRIRVRSVSLTVCVFNGLILNFLVKNSRASAQVRLLCIYHESNISSIQLNLFHFGTSLVVAINAITNRKG